MPSLTDAVEPLEQEIAVKADPWSRLQDFSGALLRGETFAALEAARDPCPAAPNMAEAHYAYGQAWRARGKLERAEQAFSSLQNCDRERPSP
jgi:tetratricopeptide (TPR) repeat protein